MEIHLPDRYFPDGEEQLTLMPILQARVKNELSEELIKRINAAGGEGFFLRLSALCIYEHGISSTQAQKLMQITHRVIMSKDIENIPEFSQNEKFGFLCFMAYILKASGIYGMENIRNIDPGNYLEYAKEGIEYWDADIIQNLGEWLIAESDEYLPKKSLQRIKSIDPNSHTGVTKVIDNTKKPALRLVISHK